jgi:hypothetical protein
LQEDFVSCVEDALDRKGVAQTSHNDRTMGSLDASVHDEEIAGKDAGPLHGAIPDTEKVGGGRIDNEDIVQSEWALLPRLGRGRKPRCSWCIKSIVFHGIVLTENVIEAERTFVLLFQYTQCIQRASKLSREAIRERCGEHHLVQGAQQKNPSEFRSGTDGQGQNQMFFATPQVLMVPWFLPVFWTSFLQYEVG